MDCDCLDCRILHRRLRVLLEGVRDVQNLVIRIEVTQDRGRERHRGWVIGVRIPHAEAVLHNRGGVARLIRQADVPATRDEHVEVAHRLLYFFHEDEAAALTGMGALARDDSQIGRQGVVANGSVLSGWLASYSFGLSAPSGPEPYDPSTDPRELPLFDLGTTPIQ